MFIVSCLCYFNILISPFKFYCKVSLLECVVSNLFIDLFRSTFYNTQIKNHVRAPQRTEETASEYHAIAGE